MAPIDASAYPTAARRRPDGQEEVGGQTPGLRSFNQSVHGVSHKSVSLLAGGRHTPGWWKKKEEGGRKGGVRCRMLRRKPRLTY